MKFKVVFSLFLLCIFSEYCPLFAQLNDDHPAGDHGSYGDDSYHEPKVKHVTLFGDDSPKIQNLHTYDDQIDDGYHGDSRNPYEDNGGETPMQRQVREMADKKLKEQKEQKEKEKQANNNSDSTSDKSSKSDTSSNNNSNNQRVDQSMPPTDSDAKKVFEKKKIVRKDKQTNNLDTNNDKSNISTNNNKNSNINTNNNNSNNKNIDQNITPKDAEMKEFVQKKKIVQKVKEIQKTKKNILQMHKKLKEETKKQVEKPKYANKENSDNYKKCGLKPPIHEMPANYLISQDKMSMDHVYEFGVNIMLQRFTLLLDYGDHCFHQPVLANSGFVTYFKEYHQEPLLVTLFDSTNKPVKSIYEDTGNITVYTTQYERLHICFRNDHYYQRKVFVVMDVEPNPDKMKNNKLPLFVQYENKISTNVRRIDALVHYRIAMGTIQEEVEYEYLRIMSQRSFFMVMGAVMVLALQCYFIHWIFETPSPGFNNIQLYSTQPYRMMGVSSV